MARPVDEQKRIEIAFQALAVVREQGIHAITMASLARAMGMKRSTLYWYFPDLGSMLGTVFGHLRAEASAETARRLIGRTHPLDMLAAVMEGEHAFWEAHGVEDHVLLLSQFVAAGDAEAQQSARREINRQLAPTKALLSGMLAQGIQRGQVAPCDPDDVVELFFAITDGALIHAALSGHPPTRLHPLVHDLILRPLRREEA